MRHVCLLTSAVARMLPGTGSGHSTYVLTLRPSPAYCILPTAYFFYTFGVNLAPWPMYGLKRFSSPIVVLCPWPGQTTVSPGSV